MPGYSEIAKIFGWKSKNAAFKFVKKLIKLNIIGKDDNGRLISLLMVNPVKILGVVKA